jgi:hypothetical protein
VIEEAIERLASLRPWPAPVIPFLRRARTVDWLTEVQKQSGRSDDETAFLLLAAMRSLDLTILDGVAGVDQLGEFLDRHGDALKELCRTRRVQANVAEHGLPVLELLGRRWGRRKLFVTELGCSFGLIGRVLVSAPQTLQNFDRYFAPTQQRPTDVPLVVGYRGLDLDPPDERWLLACIPLQSLRTRIARLIYEVPAGPEVTVTVGTAFDLSAWGTPPPGTVPVVLTSFLLYQLDPAARKALEEQITVYKQTYGGTWVNIDVLTDVKDPRFVVQEDGVDRIDLENDLCMHWNFHGR